jgi:chromosome segregation ATPase
LRTTKIDDLNPDDISKSIVSLCDKVASLEEECDSLSKCDAKTSAFETDAEQLRQRNSSMQIQLADLRKTTESMQRSETELVKELNTLRRQQEQLQRHAADAHISDKGLDAENTRKVRYLEKENLQLIKDLKAAKTKLQSVKAEMNVLRLRDSDDTTMEIHALKGRLASSFDMETASKKATEKRWEKENTGNEVRSVEPKIEERRVLAPGLGEAHAANDENTQECKQS